MSRIRQMTDFPRNEQGLVDRFLGTAYDIVKEVYINLPLLKKLNESKLEDLQINWAISDASRMNWKSTLMPAKKIGSLNYRLFPFTSYQIIGDSPYTDPLFLPVETEEGGLVRAKFIGKSPVFGTIEADIRMLMRVPIEYFSKSLNNENFRLDYDMALYLLAENPPAHETPGEDNYRRLLSRNNYHHPANTEGILFDSSLSMQLFSDPLYPVTDSRMKTLYAFGEPVKYNIHRGKQPIKGYIEGLEEDLVLDNNSLTTQWVDIEYLSKVLCGAHFVYKGDSKTRIIQYKDADGVIFKEPSDTILEKTNPLNLIRFPYRAKQVRICYKKGVKDIVEDGSMRLIEYGYDLMKYVDPRAGMWIPVDFNCKLPVTLYPNTTYSLGTRIDGVLFSDKENPTLQNNLDFRILEGSVLMNLKGSPYNEKFKDLIIEGRK